MKKTARSVVQEVDVFPAYCKAFGIGEPVKEYRFAPPRRFRFDYAFLAEKVALEVEGGIWTGGRHTRGAGFEKDREKYNLAAVEGWVVLRTTPSELATKTGDVLNLIASVLRKRAA